MRKLSRFLAPIGVILVIVALVGVLNAFKPQPKKKEEIDRTVSLAVETVSQRSVTLTVSTQGEVRAQNELDIVPQVTGRIVKMSPAFAAGGAFKAGETLIEIDDSDYKLALTRANARVADARVTLERQLADAKIKAKQWREWVKDGSAPTDLALNKPQVAQAEANMQAALADREAAELNLKRTRITLPFDGRVRERLANHGQIVNAGTKLGRVFATNKVEVMLPLTDTQLAELDIPIGFNAVKGEEPEVTLSAYVAGEKRQWKGKIARTHAAMDNATRLIYAVAVVDAPYGKGAKEAGMPLAVGLFVSAEIQGRISRNAMVMPRVALRNGNEVLVVNADDKLETRTVVVMATDKDNLYVSEGVIEGDKVVVSSVQKAVNGMKVNSYARADTPKSSANAAR